MGLRIEGNVVIVDHDITEHLATTAEGNPTRDDLDDFTVFSVFQRKRTSAKQARQRETRVLGDNCPLIYALKQRDGLSVGLSSIKLLNAHIPTILDAVVGHLEGQFDSIVPMPSSSPLALILAKRLSRLSKRPYFKGVFLKATNAQASAVVSAAIAEDPRAFERHEWRPNKASSFHQ
ncbi:hypothetical protein [Rhizobium sp. BK376]|uniref:hypothetical protein n=1 Tax=Rhizobium sp. BK376 TaxID=2512149 RepID=UPI00104B12BA|nr:hypothetical protein [Rhizobium sp. BK376]TCR76686.1 hypothetical protein EV561_12044 [Rhizobium sp. BK376]